MKEDLISVIMPAHNSSCYIKESIESVLRQSYKSWELLIVNDHSTDETEDIVIDLKKKDDRIKYIKLTGDTGVVAARQKGIDLAKGRYIAFLDSDDLWLPDKLDKQIDFMKKKNSNISCTSYEKILENGEKTRKVIKCLPRVGHERVLLDCPIGNSTVIIDRATIRNIIIPNVEKREDFALWLMLSQKYSIDGLGEILTLYRLRNESVSAKKINLIKWQWNVYKNFEKLGYISSALHVLYYCFIKLIGVK